MTDDRIAAMARGFELANQSLRAILATDDLAEYTAAMQGLYATANMTDLQVAFGRTLGLVKLLLLDMSGGNVEVARARLERLIDGSAEALFASQWQLMKDDPTQE